LHSRNCLVALVIPCGAVVFAAPRLEQHAHARARFREDRAHTGGSTWRIVAT